MIFGDCCKLFSANFLFFYDLANIRADKSLAMLPRVKGFKIQEEIMPVLSAADITKSYGVTPILEKVSFHVEAGAKIGVIGVNGAGKTTLLNILAGKERSDSGSVFMSRDTTLGYLRQQDDFDDNSTLLDETKRIYAGFERMESEMSELSQRIAAAASAETASAASAETASASGTAESAAAASKDADTAAEGSDSADYEAMLKRYGDLQERYKDMGGFTYKSEMRGILSSMAFDEKYYDKKIGTLSGGERTRLALACLLMEKPDILLLDEPTNHLDIGMLKWLEQFLHAYKGAVMIVSHDRYFLDQMAEQIFEIENHKLKTYTGNYTEYAEKKRQIREADLRAYNKQQDEIRRQEDIIRKFKERGTEHLAKRAASREKKLEAMDLIEKPDSAPGTLKIRFHQKYKSGNDIFTAEDLSMSFNDFDQADAYDGQQGSESSIMGRKLYGRQLFSGVSFDIKRGERICIVGSNGIGKTTLLRILAGELTQTGGYLKRGVNLDIGYYDQRQERLDPEKTVMDEIYDTFRLYKESEIRAFLGRFLFKGDSVFSMVGDLSGGEKARLALLKLMMSGTNVLLLDEPTNHLDIESKEIFEEALLAYPGTVIAVSHDRYFLNKIATKIYEMEAGGITKYEGGYDYYEEKKAQVTSTSKYIKDLKAGGSSVPASPAGGSAGSVPSAGAKQSEAAGSEDFDDRPMDAAEARLLNKKRDAEIKRQKRRKAKLEEDIEKTEQEIEDIQQKMCEPEVLQDHRKLNDYSERLDEAKSTLDDLYEEWMSIE